MRSPLYHFSRFSIFFLARLIAAIEKYRLSCGASKKPPCASLPKTNLQPPKNRDASHRNHQKRIERPRSRHSTPHSPTPSYCFLRKILCVICNSYSTRKLAPSSTFLACIMAHTQKLRRLYRVECRPTAKPRRERETDSAQMWNRPRGAVCHAARGISGQRSKTIRIGRTIFLLQNFRLQSLGQRSTTTLVCV